MYIYLIRHGQTEWNVQKRIQGREDIPLSEEGRLQAERCSRAFSGRELAAVLSSPLSRAVDTAKVIAAAANTTVSADNRLIERDFGAISGTVLSDVYAIEQYEDIESVPDTAERMLSALEEYAENFNKDFAAVSHGGSINSVLKTLSDGAFGSGKTRLKNTCINVLKWENGKFSVMDYNLEPAEFEEKYNT